MKPFFLIKINGVAATDEVNKRLLELSIEDAAGEDNDRVTLGFDDRDEVIELPPHGEKFEVYLGYAAAEGHHNPYDGLKKMGLFVLDDMEISFDSSGRRLDMNGHAAFMENTLKAGRDRSYHETTIGAIVLECCQRNGYEVFIDPEVANVKIDHRDQRSESDYFFLNLLGRDFGCTFKVLNGKCYFAPEGKIKELADLIGDTTIINREDIISYRYVSQGRGKYLAVKARYHDKDKTGHQEFVLSDQGENAEGIDPALISHLPRIYPNKEEAQRAAQMRKNALDTGEGTLSFVCIGDPELMAEGSIELEGFRQGIPTEWRLVKVVHRYSGGGYICECSCELLGQRKKPKRRRRHGKGRLN